MQLREWFPPSFLWQLQLPFVQVRCARLRPRTECVLRLQREQSLTCYNNQIIYPTVEIILCVVAYKVFAPTMAERLARVSLILCWY